MKTIIIKTQKEMDALPSEFSETTEIEIRSKEVINVRIRYKNATVYAYNSSTVYVNGSVTVHAYGSSTVYANVSVTVHAYGSSTVHAYGSSTVHAYGSSTVHAYNSSTVHAYNSSTVYAYNSSTVYAYNSSTVHAYNSSTVYAYNSSTVHAYGSSTVHAFLCSFLVVYSVSVKIKSLLDNSRLIYRITDGQRPEKQDSTAIITEYEDLITPSFEQWLERGFVVADGVYQKLISQKTIGDVTIYETDQGFVAQKGDKFAHGKTIEEARRDLRYKLSDRDVSKYETWKLDNVKSTDELIESYMAITGACSFGTKQFCESIQLKDSYTVEEIIELTKGKYGNEQYSEFFLNNQLTNTKTVFCIKQMELK